MNGPEHPATGGGPSESPSPNALPLGTRISDFEITGIVGEGGFGIVYEAFDHTLHRKVALKEYMPNTLARRLDGASIVLRSQRFETTFVAGLKSYVNEARLLAQFDHPALVKVFRFWEQNDTAYMVMPLYEGRTLKEFLREHPAPDEGFLKALTAPLLDALEILHAARCYHRDIAPDNILVLDSGAPVLLDFGAARRIIGEGAQDVTVVLKPGYAPVEQYADDETIRQGPWTDVYAMSAVLRFAITGKAPPASVTRVVTDPVHPLVESVTGYSRDFLRAIDYGFAVRPEDRPQSIADYRQMLGIRTLAPSQPRSGAARPPAGKATASVAQDPPASAPEASPPAAPTIAPEVPQPDPPAPFKLDSVTGSTPALQATPPPAAPLVDVGTMPPPKGIGRRGWLVVGGGTVLAAVAIVGFYLAMRPASDAPGVGAKADARAPAVESNAIRAPAAPVVEPVPPAAPVRAAEPTRADTSTLPRSAPTSPAVAVPKDVGGTKAAEGKAAPTAPAAARAPATPDAASPPPAAAPPTGRIVLDIKPWGEVYVDGRKRGLSPPLKNLQLPEGRYRIEVRNPAAATIARDVEVKAGRSATIAHTFK